MRIHLLFAVLVGILTPLGLTASDFPLVAPDVWSIKDDATQGKGAMVSESRLQVTQRYIERYKQIRITSEVGKAAAEFHTFSDACYDIAGATIYPDGRVVPFTKKDLQSKTAIQIGSSRVKRTVLVPPGLNADCVVEIRWRESKNFIEGAMHGGFGDQEIWRLSERYPVRKAVVEMMNPFVWNWQFLPGKASKVDKSEKMNSYIFTIQGIPPMDEAPYSIPGAENITRILLYPQPNSLRYAVTQGPDAFWNEVGRQFLKPYFENGIRKGHLYKTLSSDMRHGLPAEPRALASELMKRLDQRVRNLSMPTFEEKAKETKQESRAAVEAKDLDEAAKRNATNGLGMMFLFVEILKDAGLKPKIALVSDREQWILNAKLMNWQQFHNLLIGVEGGDKAITWFDPSMRFAAPGLLHDSYQGVSAMVYDAESWKGQLLPMGVQPAAFNVVKHEYQIELGEEEDFFRMDAAFSGFPEYTERQRFLALEPKEQSRLLMEDVEQRRKDVSVTKADVMHTSDPTQNVSWHMEGRMERETERRRTVDPSPFSPMAHWVPDHFEADRKTMIVFPHAGIYLTKSQFKVPKRWRVPDLQSMSKSNFFGKVHWRFQKAEQSEGTLCTVEVRVDTEQAIGRPAEYAQFREFLGWVQDACTRTIVLEKAQ